MIDSRVFQIPEDIQSLRQYEPGSKCLVFTAPGVVPVLVGYIEVVFEDGNRAIFTPRAQFVIPGGLPRIREVFLRDGLTSVVLNLLN